MHHINLAPNALLTEVGKIVRKHFYKSNFNGVPWTDLCHYYKQELVSNADADVSCIINRMLSELRVSHTHYYTKRDSEYYQLLSIFNFGPFSRKVKKIFSDGVVRYPTIGILTKRKTTGDFISAVLDGTPAALAGLKAGDRIVSIDGDSFSPVCSFAKDIMMDVVVTIQRSEHQETLTHLNIKPEMLEPSELFLEAMRASREIINVMGTKIAYIHIWSYAGDTYHRLLTFELTKGMLKDADGLVLDVRDGLGGADPSYLGLFTDQAVVLSAENSFQENSPPPQRKVKAVWRKPVIMLINEDTRSGKEVLAYAFKKFNVGRVIGTRTAGAVVLGRPFLLKDNSLLYLAVSDIYVNGKRLEGVGVNPDIDIPMQLDYREGKDKQKKRAIDEMVSIIQQQKTKNYS